MRATVVVTGATLWTTGATVRATVVVTGAAAWTTGATVRATVVVTGATVFVTGAAAPATAFATGATVLSTVRVTGAVALVADWVTAEMIPALATGASNNQASRTASEAAHAPQRRRIAPVDVTRPILLCANPRA